jgi:hypothetical protein
MKIRIVKSLQDSWWSADLGHVLTVQALQYSLCTEVLQVVEATVRSSARMVTWRKLAYNQFYYEYICAVTFIIITLVDSYLPQTCL